MTNTLEIAAAFAQNAMRRFAASESIESAAAPLHTPHTLFSYRIAKILIAWAGGNL